MGDSGFLWEREKVNYAESNEGDWGGGDSGLFWERCQKSWKNGHTIRKVNNGGQCFLWERGKVNYAESNEGDWRTVICSGKGIKNREK